MALQKYTVDYRTTGAPTNLTNVQGIQFTIGRQSQLDQIKTSTATIVLRYPTGYASPIAALVSGTEIQISNTTNPSAPNVLYIGYIDNVTAEYGIPYAGGVGQADYLTISCESTFAKFGRMQGNNYAMTSALLSTQTAGQCSTQTGLTVNFYGGGSDPVLAATTVSSTWADWISRACQSTNSRIQEQGSTMSIVGPFYNQTATIKFSDTTNNATNQVYNQINFGSLADNFYTQITVDPESFAEVTVTQGGAAVPYRTYQTNTLNSSVSQATDYANYLLGQFGTAKFAITSVTCMAEAQTSFGLDSIYIAPYAFPGTQVAVVFRGTTYNCIIEGVNISATPAGALYTYYFSGAELNNVLILDNAVFGTLDYNRLGY